MGFKKTKICKVMDSIDVLREHIVSRPQDSLIFAIQQESIRFKPFKKLALYIEGRYFGNYQVVYVHPFTLEDLSDIASLLFLGVRKKEGIQQLLKYRIKGRISKNTRMAFLCLLWLDYEPKFEIKTSAKILAI